MKLKSLIIFISCFSAISLFGQEEKPKLVVMITVDQMRHDYIAKYWERFNEGGFKRLVNDGFSFDNANFSYVPTMTAVGHATIGTGTTPVHHGIAANDWYDRQTKNDIYCVEDTTVTSVGVNGKDGMHSPRNLKSNTFTDQLKLSSSKSKVFGISIKDRGAILPVGFSADAAYWFSGDKGHFISSSYYMSELPKWVNAFNAKKQVEVFLKSPWNTLYPIETYTASSADKADFEGKFKSEMTSTFPHVLPNLIKDNGLGLIKGTPFGNSLLTDFAKELIIKEELGIDNITDALSVSFSSTDYIGHMYGPQSIEVEDTYLRLDQDLANFLEFLDQQIGENQYIVVLTSDHGVADIPAHVQGSVGYYDYKAFKEALANWSTSKYEDDVLEVITNNQIYLNYDVINSRKLKLKEVKEELLHFLLNYPSITSAADMIGRTCVGDEAVCQRMYNGYDPKRSGDVFYSFQPGWLSDYYQKRGGTGHSTAYKYDTHVPMIWYGWGVNSGIEKQEVAIKDIAVTLSDLIDIPSPNGSTGKSLMPFIAD
tara:strand:- start:523 stop:2139 length:1617 start_codon:yes stop_codon:yes gene_type:complete